MANIPLVDNNGKDSINTSVIAIKKELEQIESLLQNARNKLKSLSDNDFLYRSDLTDEVTVGNNQPVTSNAVADKINSLDVSSVGGSGKYISEISETDGKINATATDLGNMEPIDTVTSGDMHSVTSNAVAAEVILKSDFSNLEFLGQGTAIGQFTLNKSLENYKLIMVGVVFDRDGNKRTSIELLPTLILVNRNTQNNSLAISLSFNSSAYIGMLYHFVDNTHIYIDQISYSSSWYAGGSLMIWGIK